MRARRLTLVLRLSLAATLMLAVWVLFVWAASRPAWKALIDLTPQQVNSVDPATEELLQELRSRQAQVEFHLFYPPFQGQAADDLRMQEFRIRDRLRELTRLLLVRYQAIGGEAVAVHAHDFYADAPKTREAAQRFDYKDAESDVIVVAVRLPGKELRFRKLSLPLDLGRIERPNLGDSPLSRAATLPVLKGYKGEEAISSALKSLLVEGIPIAYLLRDVSPDLRLDETGDGYGLFLAALGRTGFEVRQWQPAAQSAVPADAALVLVLEPRRDFSVKVAEALFDYVKRGGRVFLNYSWSALPDWNPEGGRFAELLGFTLSAAPVFHRIPDPLGRTAGRGTDGDPAVAKLQLLVNPLHPTTRRFAQSGRPMEVAAARELRERQGAPASVRREPLLRTGDQGWLAVPGPDGYPSFRAPAVGLRAFDVGMAFELPVSADDPGAPPVGAPRSGVVVVVSGLFCNNAGMGPFGDVALNICNWMAERRVLLDLKDTGYEARYLSIKPPQLQRIGLVLFYGVPGLFAALGLIVFWRRRRQ